MTSVARIIPYVFVLAAAGCADKLPLDNSPCPCPASLGYVCCDMGGVRSCVRPNAAADTICEADGFDGGSDDGPAPVAPGESFVSIGIGNAHACGVRANGTISCFGSNEKGQAIPPAGEFYEVIAGGDHTCASKVDRSDFTKDHAWTCWGDNTYGQTTLPFEPMYVVAAGSRHTCGAGTQGGLVCWGDNTFGQATPPPGMETRGAVAGRNHNCAQNAPGATPEIFCWGDNSRGQATVPVGLPTLGFIRSMAAGGDHTCITNANFETWCWGDNLAGQFTPPRDSIEMLSIAAGHGCGVNTFEYKIVCWGPDWGGSLSVPPSGDFSRVWAGEYRTCAQPRGGTHPVVCWGPSYEAWY
jgi:hypothetical protein